MQSSDAIAPACSNSASLGTCPRSSSSARVRSIVVSPTARERDADVGERLAVDPHRGGGRRDRPVAGAPLDLLVRGAAARPLRQAHLGEDLALAHRGRPRAEVELGPSAPCACRRRPRSRPWPSRAAQTADRSSAASAWQSEPPIVPRLRTTGSAMTVSASWKSGKCCASSSDLSSSTWRVSAPMAISSPSSRMYCEVGEVVDVDQPRRAREPQLHHRQQAVPAGDDARSPRAPSVTRSRPAGSSPARTQTALGSASVASYWMGESVPMIGERPGRSVG